MTIAKRNTDFLGRGWAFPPTFEASSGQVQMVQDDVDIQQSLFILFSTIQRERLMLPEYGSNLQNFVFDSLDSALLSNIKSALANAILFFEPRIAVNLIEIVQVEPNQGWLQINLSYTIRQTNTRSNMVYPFYLEGEGTNVRRIA